ncbi:MAG: PEGA domain-containing protein [Deltaproteobacteria bacterium]|nr:PEGA domain-containing protein [Deltaproteobacteria bacterium]
MCRIACGVLAMFIRSLVVLLATSFAAPWARAATVLIVTDPQSSTKPVILLEHALVDELRRLADTHVVASGSPAKPVKGTKLIKEAESLRAAARARFDELEVDTAQRGYTKALQKLDKAAALSEDLRPLVDTLAMLAAANLLLGQERRARQLLERLLVLDVDIRPSETVFNPQMMAVFDAVQARVRGAEAQSLDIEVDPPGAAVFFDGRLVGVAPVTVREVRRGKHYVTASLKGFQPAGRVAEAKGKAGQRVTLKLSETRGSPRLDGQATAAVAAVDAEDMPAEAKELARTYKADTVILLAAAADQFKLARFAADGSDGYRKVYQGGIADVEGARTAARELLSGLKAASTPATTVVSTSTTTSGDSYSDSFGDEGEKDKPKDEVAEAAEGVTAEVATGDGFLFSPNPAKERALFITYGGAVGLAALGAVFGTWGLMLQNEFLDPDTDQVAGADVKARGERRALIADILYLAAGLCAATGFGMHLFWNPDGEASPAESPLPGESTPTPANGEGTGLFIGPGMVRWTF